MPSNVDVRTPASRPPTPAAAPESADPVVTVEGIAEFRLGNGLRVLLLPDPSKSTVTVNMTYLVGSRHEGRGEKGMAHLLEHMLFKGTTNFANVWGALEDHGARFNGTTSFDRTNYFETLPATDENLDFALELEAERMVASTIAAEELQKEFSVVRNEFEMGENDPSGILVKRIYSTAYLWHNYGCPTIGNRSDIERVPATSLKRFYATYYQPDNALLVVTGKFEPARALAKIHDTFGKIPRPARLLEATYTVEPVQDGARYVELERVGGVQAAAAAWHTCAGPHPDAPALSVLAGVLAAEPAGRLYQALVSTDRATRVGAYFQNLAEPGLFLTHVEARPSQDIRAVHDMLLAVVEGLAAEPVRPEEFERARTALLNHVKLVLSDSTRIGIQLSEWQAQGDWRLFFLHRDRLKALTPDDVRRAAARYFLPTNRTSGIFRPLPPSAAAPSRAVVPETPDVQELVGRYTGTETIADGEAFVASAPNIEQRTERATLAAGLRLALFAKRARGSQVQMRLRLHFGSEDTLNGRQGALELLPELLLRGSRRLDHQALKDELERLSSRLHLASDGGRLEATVQSERDSIAAVIELLAELLRSPALAPAELEIVRKEQLASLEEARTDPRRLAMRAAQRCLRPFPAGTFHHVPTIDEELERLRAATPGELGDLAGRFLGAGHVEAALLGDFDPHGVMVALERAFGGWTAAVPYRRIALPFRPAEPARVTIATPDKEMAIVCAGLAFRLRDDDPAYPAIELANYVLGQSAKSRLMNRLRHEGGMSYGVGSSLEVAKHDDASTLSCFAICAPENARRAQDALREELDRWLGAGLAAAELAEAQQGYAARFEGALADDRYVAERLLDGLELGRTLAFQQSVADRIQALEPADVLAALQSKLAGLPRFEVLAGDAAKMP